MLIVSPHHLPITSPSSPQALPCLLVYGGSEEKKEKQMSNLHLAAMPCHIVRFPQSFA